MRRTTIYLLALLFVPLGMASAASANEGLSEQFKGACEIWGAPPSLAMAIARLESDFRPWAVNIQGVSHYPPDRESALVLARRAIVQRKSIDIGLMQINSYWLRRLGLDPADVIDPKINLILGCWILSEELKRYGLSWKAVGAYHTPIEKNPSRARAYANKVLSVWEVYK